MKFTTLFLENFFGSIGSIIPTTTYFSAASTSVSGTELSSNYDNISDTTIGTSLITAATSVIEITDTAYDETIKELELTQAYMESLNEEQLNNMIEQLENISFTESQDSQVVYSKKTKM